MLPRELFVKASHIRFFSLMIRSVNPVLNDTTIKLKFFSPLSYEAGGISLKFSSSQLPTFQVLGCSSEKSWDTFRAYGTGPFVWTITYKKWSKKLFVVLNGEPVLEVQRSKELCDKYSSSNSDDVWKRDKIRVMFNQDDTASLNYKVCHVCPCKWLAGA